MHLHLGVGGDEVSEWNGTEAGELLGWSRGGGDVEERAQLVELRGQDWGAGGIRLDGDSVGPQVDVLDESLGGWKHTVVVELEECRVRASGEAADRDVIGIAAKKADVFGDPFKCTSLVPKAEV